MLVYELGGAVKCPLIFVLQALSRIYAGTGALKSSFTRHGKMSLAGALADARKSATRIYMNNFADKGRQMTMDMLLVCALSMRFGSFEQPNNRYFRAG